MFVQSFVSGKNNGLTPGAPVINTCRLLLGKPKKYFRLKPLCLYKESFGIRFVASPSGSCPSLFKL